MPQFNFRLTHAALFNITRHGRMDGQFHYHPARRCRSIERLVIEKMPTDARQALDAIAVN